MKKIFALCLCAALLSACSSRDGFYEAVGKEPAGSKKEESSASSPAEEEPVEGFEYKDMSIETDSAEIWYTVPDTDIETGDAPKKIARSIDEMVRALAKIGTESVPIEIYDGLCENGSYYSCEYEVVCGGQTRWLGLVFDSETGDAVPLSSAAELDDVAAGIFDEGLSRIIGKDEELLKKQRTYLTELGISGIKDMLSSARGSFPGGIPRCSYVTEGDSVIVMINTDTVGTVRVSCETTLK